MKPISKKNDRREAFTIIELLTVMSIIILLMSILAPAMNRIRQYARGVNQRSQFRSIGTALEFFNTEQGGYPDSEVLPQPEATSCTTGAHRLAEALVGRDSQGFDTLSTWDAEADKTQNIYGRGSAQEIEESFDRRQGPYLDIENIGVFQISELYGSSTTTVYDGSDADSPAPVLTDAYHVIDVALPPPINEVLDAGSPILYYTADVFERRFIYTEPENSIYDSRDNEDLISLGHIRDGTSVPHHFDENYTDGLGRDGREIFYDAITNHQIRPINIGGELHGSPFNRDSYILISAGPDSLYGTHDDVFNFGN